MEQSVFPLVISFIGGGFSYFIAYLLNLGKYKEKMSRFENDLKICQERVELNHSTIADIRTSLATLNEFKEHAQKFIDSKLYQANSPLSLSEEGKRLVKESGFESIFEIIKDELCQRFSEKRIPKTRYDVQESARGFMDAFSREDYAPFRPIKSYAFEKGADYSQILRAGSILLRDYYLSIHPEIKD